MAWQDRILEAAYTTPEGERFVFAYEDVSISVDKKTTSFEFPDFDGTYVQDFGKTGRRIPLRFFISGDDYDTESDRLFLGLGESGIGILEHPKYGVINVVTTGQIRRRDDLKTAGNQAVFEVSFFESIEIAYPLNVFDPGTNVLESIDEFNDLAALDFEDTVLLESVLEEVTLKNQILGFVDFIASSFSAIVAFTTSVQNTFNSIRSSIINGIDTLINSPLALANQIQQLIQAPARALVSIRERLNTFRSALDSVLYGTGTDDTGALTDTKIIQISSDENNFRLKDLIAQTYITGSILSVLNNEFETKIETIKAAEEILSQLDDVVEWREENINALGLVDSGDSYQKIQEAVSIAAGYLVDLSFDLKTEYSIILDKNRSIIDLESELYGTIDENMDKIIINNDLTGDEILELKKGQEILYYV